MQERLTHQKIVLANGCTSYFLAADVPFTTLVLQIPIGLSHNIGEIIPGAFHLLEHMTFCRSELYPGYEQFQEEVGKKGGSFGAEIDADHISYRLSLPTEKLAKFLPGLVAQIFQPTFQEKDIISHRSIIKSEYQMKQRWYPGSSELGQYIRTKWEWDYPYPLRQMLGEEEDLAKIDVPYLRNLHQYYFSSGLRLIAGGSGDLTPLLKELEQLPLTSHQLPSKRDPLHWVNQQYHEQAFRDVGRYELRLGRIITPRPDVKTGRAISFILNFLVNIYTGPLYVWLRKEKGWVYDLSASSYVQPDSQDWIIFIPLTEKAHLEEVRQQWWEKANKALKNEATLRREVERLLGSSAYWYETLNQRLNEAVWGLNTYNQIIYEQDWQEYIKACADPAYIQQVWKQYFSPEDLGSFTAVPQTEAGNNQL